MNDVDLAYIAGLIDGEGYIGIKKSTYQIRVVKDMVNPSYHERIQIRMVDEEAIKFIADNFGGFYYKEKPHSRSPKPLYCYQASDLKATNILKQILPFLKVKRKNAEIVLKLRESKEDPRARSGGNRGGRRRGKGIGMPSNIVEYREHLYLLAKSSNGKGKW
jgi:hypothetical protein